MLELLCSKIDCNYSSTVEAHWRSLSSIAVAYRGGQQNLKYYFQAEAHYRGCKNSVTPLAVFSHMRTLRTHDPTVDSLWVVPVP